MSGPQLQANYDIVVVTLNQGEGAIMPAGNFNAPPGYRLHSTMILPTNIIGGPVRVVCFFERIAQIMTAAAPIISEGPTAKQ